MDNFKSVKDNLQASLVSTIKSVNRIAAHDLSFQRTIHPDVDERLDQSTERILKLANRILKAAPKPGKDSTPQLEEAEDIDIQWRRIVDVVDATFEKADVALDEYTGLIKRKDPPAEAEKPPPKKAKSASALQPSQRNANITKPQLSFDVPPDNYPTTPWKPILTRKPHAIVPLEESLRMEKKASDGSLQYTHPYETEIQQMKYPERVYQQAEPIKYSPIKESDATWVDTYEGVLDMLKELKQAKEIAIDLEHHDYRTYMGLTCLMQISTRDKDWIVDTLQPWRHQLEVLNEVFADPNIIKVLHGAFMDVIWLQRDLGLYLNGYFDTNFASESLGYQQRSLAFLLKKFADFDADKKYQLADWRMRPLQEEMFFYARSDTHFLLYIYDMVRNELVEKSDRSSPETDLIERVLQKSRNQALNRYEHLSFDDETGGGSRGWYGVILKQPQALSGEQFSVFRAVWKWRDDLARQTDESPSFVLPQQGVWDIARVLPPDLKALHSLIPRHSWQARAAIDGLWKVVQEAQVAGRSGPSLQKFLTSGAKLTANAGKEDSVPDAGLKLEEAEVPTLPRSHLFGDRPISSLWEGAAVATKGQDDYIQLPWQRLYAEKGIELAVRGPPEEKVKENKSVVETPKVQPVEDTEFTLKAGRKRKRLQDQAPENAGQEMDIDDDEDAEEAGEAEESEEAEDTESGSAEDAEGQTSPSEDPSSEPVSSEEKESKKGKKTNQADIPEDLSEGEKEQRIKEERAQKKKERKERQKAKALAKKLAAGGKEAGEAAGDEAEPFDYASAKSILHGKKNAEGSVPGLGKGKTFDPYLKSDGIKGARKAPPIRGGRSATFKK
ncbi:related to nucleolar 100K polymyositis-scleroderma protein [Cephalotrichum gorgonifer]|uniref:Related to nucleolar 100K polymyositis-scleroderma protein n=1 Tax=Cephalotrichum gorgonifer TaxID=2041049 RepID=A0AAE8SX34_9PEZI|nr:related to nucleolar 100K polymyositis-scleroderma protein [Cephalotrichum gorgonifer]